MNELNFDNNNAFRLYVGLRWSIHDDRPSRRRTTWIGLDETDERGPRRHMSIIRPERALNTALNRWRLDPYDGQVRRTDLEPKPEPVKVSAGPETFTVVRRHVSALAREAIAETLRHHGFVGDPSSVDAWIAESDEGRTWDEILEDVKVLAKTGARTLLHV